MPFKSIGSEMDEFKAGNLHSGGPGGPVVKNPKQAIAIALSEARRAGQNIAPPKPPGYKNPKERVAIIMAEKKRGGFLQGHGSRIEKA